LKWKEVSKLDKTDKIKALLNKEHFRPMFILNNKRYINCINQFLTEGDKNKF